MATYRISTFGRAAALSGNASLAILNKASSGRRLLIRNIEIHPHTRFLVPRQRQARFGRTTAFAMGRLVTPVPLDTDTAAAELSVGLHGSVAVLTETARRVNLPVRDDYNTALGLLTKNGQSGSISGRRLASGGWRGRASARERFILSPGESAAYVLDYAEEQLFGFVNVEFRNTTSGKRYMLNEWTYAMTVSDALFVVTNTSATEDYEVVGFDFQGAGSPNTTPYFQVVPFSALDTDHISESRLDAIAEVFKMDTTSPDPSSYMTILYDCSLSPLGVPPGYFAEGSTGSPKGFNYLQTKDFLGPVYATLFPERLSYGATAGPDGFKYFGQNRIKRRGRVDDSSITIRPGEGIAIVSAAETAVTSATVPVNGWILCEFILDIEDVALYAPELTLTGLQPDTEVRIFDAGTTTLLAGQEDIDSGTFSWAYDYETYTSVDISILSLGYQNIRLTGLPITFAGLTVPIQQQIDRQYENP